MRLDYSYKQIRLFVGDSEFEITDYLDGFELAVPDMDLGQRITWQGGFQLSYNTKALRGGLTEADFSPYVHPDRWRPDRRLAIEFRAETGETHRIPLRIRSYSYTPATNTSPGIGQGEFYQLLDAVDKDRPAIDAGFSVGGATGVPGEVSPGNNLALVVQRLLDLAFSGSSVQPASATVSGIWGGISDVIATRNPIADAADLAATCWQWIIARDDEGATLISGDPMTHPILFTRARGQFEIEAEERKGDWASKAIVTGSYQVARPPDEDCGGDGAPPDPNDLDDQKRPKIIRTTSTATFAEVFPNGGTSSALTTLERKTILYQYADSLPQDNLVSLWTQVNVSMSVPNPLAIPTYIPSIDQSEGNEVVGTMTIREKPAGSIFESLGTNDNLRIYEIEIESERRKVRLRPWGLINEAAGTNFTLYPSPDEQIDIASASRPEPQPYLETPGDNNSKRCLEKKIEKEPRQTAPDWQMETVPVRGECEILPENWAPVLGFPRIEDFGFIPSQAHANALACHCAAKWARETDPWRVTLPIAPEWIIAGCPPYFRCHLHDAHYEAVACTIVQNDGRTQMQFQANRIGSAPVAPAPVAPAPFIPVYDNGELTLQLTANVGSIVGISGEDIGPFYVTASGGNP
jgi:hypothetical protein